MKITWLGQAGLLLDNGQAKIMVDPYFSNSVGEIDPKKSRRVPVKEELFLIEPDLMVFTHDHLDHYDPETARIFLGGERSPMTVLCPTSVWKRARELGGAHNYVLFDTHTEWTELDFRFRAVKAVHSDAYAIGVIMEDLTEKKTYYVTGDTLYSKEIFLGLPENIDIVFLPVNGVGNNMNVSDAARFFKDCKAKWAAPYHVGMFDEKGPKIFDAENCITLEIYKEMEA